MNSKTRSNAFLHCITAVGALLLALAIAPPPIFKPRSAKFKVETPSLRLSYTGLGCLRF